MSQNYQVQNDGVDMQVEMGTTQAKEQMKGDKVLNPSQLYVVKKQLLADFETLFDEIDLEKINSDQKEQFKALNKLKGTNSKILQEAGLAKETELDGKKEFGIDQGRRSQNLEVQQAEVLQEDLQEKQRREREKRGVYDNDDEEEEVVKDINGRIIEKDTSEKMKSALKGKNGGGFLNSGALNVKSTFKFIFSSNLDQLKSQGDSLYFYFYMLLFFACLFGCLVILQIPSLVMSGMNNSMDIQDKNQYIEWFSLANAGFNLKKTTQFFKEKARLEKIKLMAEFRDQALISLGEKDVTFKRFPRTETPVIVDRSVLGKQMLKESWTKEFADFWDPTWDDEFKAHLLKKKVDISKLKTKLDLIYSWNRYNFMKVADFYNPEYLFLNDADLSAFGGLTGSANGTTNSTPAAADAAGSTGGASGQLGFYTALLGDATLAARWVNENNDPLNDDTRIYLAPLPLDLDQKADKKQKLKHNLWLHQDFIDIQFLPQSTEETFKAVQFEQRQVQVEIMGYIQGMDVQQIKDKHKELVLKFLNKYQPELNNPDSDTENNLLNFRFYFLQTMDALSALIFCFGIYYFQYQFKKKLRKFQLKQCSARYYALRVSGFPETGVTRDELVDFFNQFGCVLEKNYKDKAKADQMILYERDDVTNKLVQVQEREQMCQEVKFIYHYEKALFNGMVLKDVIEKIKEVREEEGIKLNEKLYRIADIYKNFEGKDQIQNLDFRESLLDEKYDKIAAIVMFNEIKTPRLLMKAFSQAYSETFWQWLGWKKTKIDARFLFRYKYKLSLEVIDHPENIFWENQEVVSKGKVKLFGKIFCPLLLLLFMGMMISVASLIYSGDYEKTSCPANFKYLSSVKTRIARHPYDRETLMKCFCDAKIDKKGITAFETSFPGTEVCEEEHWFKEYVGGWFEDQKFGFIMIAVNFLISSFVFYINEKFRHRTETESAVFGITLSVITEYINTVVTLQILFMGFGLSDTKFNLLRKINEIFQFKPEIDDFKSVDSLGTDYYQDIIAKVMAGAFLQGIKDPLFEFLKIIYNRIYYFFYNIIWNFFGPCITFPKRSFAHWNERRKRIGTQEIVIQKRRSGENSSDHWDRQLLWENNNGFRTRRKEFVTIAPDTDRIAFELQERYAAVGAFFVIAIPFTGAVPLIYIIISLSLFATYFFQKWQFIKYCKVEVIHSDSLLNFFIFLMKVTLVFKIMMSIWLFPREEIFPADREIGTVFVPRDIFTLKVVIVQFMRGYILYATLFIIVLSFFFQHAIFVKIDRMQKWFDLWCEKRRVRKEYRDAKNGKVHPKRELAKKNDFEIQEDDFADAKKKRENQEAENEKKVLMDISKVEKNDEYKLIKEGDIEKAEAKKSNENNRFSTLRRQTSQQISDAFRKKNVIVTKTYQELYPDLYKNSLRGRPYDYNIYKNQNYKAILAFQVSTLRRLKELVDKIDNQNYFEYWYAIDYRCGENGDLLSLRKPQLTEEKKKKLSDTNYEKKLKGYMAEALHKTNGLVRIQSLFNGGIEVSKQDKVNLDNENKKKKSA